MNNRSPGQFTEAWAACWFSCTNTLCSELLLSPGGSVSRVCLQCGRPGFDLLGREDPLKEEVAIRSSILAWRIPWMTEPGGLHTVGSRGVGND